MLQLTLKSYPQQVPIRKIRNKILVSIPKQSKLRNGCLGKKICHLRLQTDVESEQVYRIELWSIN